MKITVYTITDCHFSKAEKEYLQSKGLTFEEKNLETNKDFLTEMLAVGNNFAGTPVTKIEKDDGQIVVLKGFTKEELEKQLAETTQTSATMSPSIVQNTKESKGADLAANDITNTPTTQATPQAPTPPEPTVPDLPSVPPIEESPPVPTPTPPSMPEMPSVPSMPVETPPPPGAVPPEPAKSAQDNQLNSILSDLQTMANKPADSTSVQPIQPNGPSVSSTPVTPTANL